MTKHFEVVDAIEFPPNQRREPGETVTEAELPKTSTPWLVEGGHIIEIKTPKAKPKAPKEGDE